MNLSEKVIAITGGAQGIGRALALQALQAGARVAVTDWDQVALNTLHTELRALGLPEERFLLTHLDVSKRSDVLDWSSLCASTFGVVHVLINNAGVNVHCPIDEIDPEDLSWLWGVNFWGVFHGVQAFLPLLEASKNGHIINISSALGLVATPGSGAYVASKFAVRGFTEALEIEMGLAGRPVKVTCVHPGGIRTGIVRNGRTRGSGRLSRSHADVTAEFEQKLARMSPEDCARNILRVISRPRGRLLVGVDAKFLDLFQRLFPRAYRRFFIWLLRRL
jgi:NAD(P)-dependent dehydrogenase (short-subunit alcohol dehydrogenase family)